MAGLDNGPLETGSLKKPVAQDNVASIRQSMEKRYTNKRTLQMEGGSAGKNEHEKTRICMHIQGSTMLNYKIISGVDEKGRKTKIKATQRIPGMKSRTFGRKTGNRSNHDRDRGTIGHT